MIRTPRNAPSISPQLRQLAVMLVVLLMAVATVIADASARTVTARADAGLEYRELQGALENGQPYRIRVPDNWNGTLLSDMDYANQADATRNLYFLKQGYALSGIQRIYPDRRYNYDPAREIDDLTKVLDLFKEEFGNPERVIQVGFSGGGNVALAMSEHNAERIDGALVWGGHNPVPMMNQGLDQLFVLKALLAPGRDDLWPQVPYQLFPDDSADMAAEWVEVIDAAQETAEGRARIALAMTIAQYPPWTKGSKPNARNVDALQQAMYQGIRQTPHQGGGVSFGGAARFMFESACGGAMSWNTGVDYRDFFENGNRFAKQAARSLYRESSVSLRDDLETVNAAPRISADPDALDCWREPGRSVRGELRAPVLRIHAIGDESVPVAQLQGYAKQVHANGNKALYRTAFLNRSGHTRGSLAEQAAALEALMKRLDTGGWQNTTQAKDLNERVSSLFPDAQGRYIHYQSDPIAPVIKFNRTWSP